MADVINTAAQDTQQAAAPAEPSMAEYAEIAHAQMRGEASPAKKAAAVDPAKNVEATDGDATQAAAVTVKAQDDGKNPSDSATEDASPDAEVEDAHPAKKGIQQRFSQMTAKQKELQALADARQVEVDTAKQEALAAKAELDQLKQKAAEAAQAAIPVVPEVADDPAPRRDDFDDPDEFVEAISSHAARQAIRDANVQAQARAKELQDQANAADKAKQQEQVNAQIAELHKDWNQKVEAAKPDYPDFDAKVTNNEKVMLSNSLYFTIQKSEMGPHVLYHLVDNPEVLASLNKMNPIDAAIKLGEIQAEIRIARKPKPSKAAEPVKPVGSRSSPQPKSPNDESMAEYAARMDQENKAAAARKPQARGIRR